MIALGISTVLYLLGAAQMYDLIEEAEVQAEEEGTYIPWQTKAMFILGWPAIAFYNLVIGAFSNKDGEDE